MSDTAVFGSSATTNSVRFFCKPEDDAISWEYWDGGAWQSCILYQPYWSGSTEDHSNLELMVPKKHRTWRYLRPIHDH